MRPDVNIKVDTKQVERLGFDLQRMAVAGLHRVVEIGERYLREEVPKKTHNLSEGISSTVDAANLKAELSVSARSGRVGVEGGLLHLPGGKTREITLRARPAFDYAEAVARGTGVYRTGEGFGPHPYIQPRTAKALLIPVDAVPLKESYITSGGQTFILRKFMRGMKPNPYDVRAAERLEQVAPAVFNEVVEAFAKQELV